MITITEMLRHARVLSSHALKFTRDKDDADDLMQEMWLKAWENRETFASGNLAGWLYTILRNIWWSNSRSFAKRCVTLTPAQWDDLLATVESTGFDLCRIDEAAAAISRLPDEMRSTFLLHAVDEVSCSDVGAALGIQRVTVRTRTIRARAILREVCA